MQRTLSSGFVPVRSLVKREESNHWLLDIGYWLLARGRLGVVWVSVAIAPAINPGLGGTLHPAQSIWEGRIIIRQPSSLRSFLRS